MEKKKTYIIRIELPDGSYLKKGLTAHTKYEAIDTLMNRFNYGAVQPNRTKYVKL